MSSLSLTALHLERREMCTRNALKNLSWFMRGHADVTSLCSAVQNYHRCTVHQTHPLLTHLSLFLPVLPRWDLRVKDNLPVHMRSREDSECCHGLWSDIWIAPGWPVTVALHKFLLSRDGFLRDEGIFTFLLPAGPGKHKRIFLHLKNFWNVSFWEKYFPAFITHLDPKLVGFQLSQPELYEKLSFVL